MEQEDKLKNARKQVSDYALAFDFMAKITHSGSEDEVVQSILQLIEMLFMPSLLYYIALENCKGTTQVIALSALKEDEAQILSRIGDFKGQQYVWTASEKGFYVKIHYQGVDFGILEIDNVQFPENKEDYLNLTLSIIDVCGLAIENARRHQRIKKTENKLRDEKKKLELALEKVKTLRGLLPICSYCKKIRDDSGYWQQIEHYIHEHSEVEFSHSMCKECAIKLFPDIEIYSD